MLGMSAAGVCFWSISKVKTALGQHFCTNANKSLKCTSFSPHLLAFSTSRQKGERGGGVSPFLSPGQHPDNREASLQRR